MCVWNCIIICPMAAILKKADIMSIANTTPNVYCAVWLHNDPLEISEKFDLFINNHTRVFVSGLMMLISIVILCVAMVICYNKALHHCSYWSISMVLYIYLDTIAGQSSVIH